MTDYLTDFVQESEERITELNNALLTLERDPTDDEAMDEIFRVAHTLKGNCGAMGLESASDLAHAIEDLLDAVRTGDLEVTPELMDVIFDAVDELETMIDEVAADGEIETDPSATIEALRAKLDAPVADGIERPSTDEIDAVIERFDPPADGEHSAYLARLDIAEREDVNNGKLVVDALIDAFDLIGTEPPQSAIEAGDYDGRFDAVFGSAVGEAAISSGLEPVEEVDDFELVDVSDRFAARADAAAEAEAPSEPGDDISSEDAADLEVDELLDEFDEFDDLDSLVEDVDDDELEAFEEMGEAGSFDDLLDEDEIDLDAEPGVAPDEPLGDDVAEAADGDDAESSADAADDDDVDDANAVFNELKDEVEMVGFDELQEELEELEFDEFDNDDEVDMDELLGDDVDLEDDSFLEGEPSDDEVDDILFDADDESAEADATSSDIDDAVDDILFDDESTETAESDATAPDVDEESTPAETEAVDFDDGLDDEDAVAVGPADGDGAEVEPADDDSENEPTDGDDLEDELLEEDVLEAEPVADDGEDEPVDDFEVEFGDGDDPAVADERAEQADDAEPTADAADAPTAETDDDLADAADDTAVVGESEESGVDDESETAVADDVAADAADDGTVDVADDSTVDADDVSVDEPDALAADDDLETAPVDADSETIGSDVEPETVESDDESESAAVADESETAAIADEPADSVAAEEPDDGLEPAGADDGTDDSGTDDSVADDAGEASVTGDTGEEVVADDTLDESVANDTVADDTLEAGAEGESDEDDAAAFEAEFDDAFAAAPDDEATDEDTDEAPADDDPFADDSLGDDLAFDDGADSFEDETADDLAFDDGDDAFDDGFGVDDDFGDDAAFEDDAGFEDDGFDDAFADDDGFGDEPETIEADAVDDATADAASFGDDASASDEGDDETVVRRVDEPTFEDSGLTVPEATDGPDADQQTDEIQSVRVDVDQIDSLLTLVEGLVTSRVRLRHAVDQGEDPGTLETELDDLEDLTTDLQETVMDVRLVPLQTVTNRLPRVVRDIAREQEKEVAFEMTGEDVELDRSILDRIGDPLIHLVRNAVDHGIEPPADREDADKPREGSVEVHADRSRDRVTITVEDDGAGLDPDRLRSEAVAADVLTEDEAAALPDEQAYDLIFHPGLSTADEVTDVSGRGVGMDVVKRTVEDLEGTVSIDSEAGSGTTVTMTLPVSVAIDDILFVESGGEEFGVPTKAVQDIEPAAVLETDDGRPALPDHEDYSVIRLDETLETPRSGVNGEGMVVRIRDEIRSVALHCDHVHGQQEVVVKPFEGFMSDIPGLSGATVRGRGEVVNILDVTTL